MLPDFDLLRCESYLWLSKSWNLLQDLIAFLTRCSYGVNLHTWFQLFPFMVFSIFGLALFTELPTCFFTTGHPTGKFLIPPKPALPVCLSWWIGIVYSSWKLMWSYLLPPVYWTFPFIVDMISFILYGFILSLFCHWLGSVLFFLSAGSLQYLSHFQTLLLLLFSCCGIPAGPWISTRLTLRKWDGTNTMC